MANNLYIENYISAIRLHGGLETKKPVTLSGTAATLTVGGATTFTVAPTGPMGRVVASSALVGATVVLTTADSGKVLVNASTSGSPSWTLPAPANGLWFTFVTGNTTAGFTVTSAAAVIHAKTTATGTAITTTTTLTNTQGTAVVGDTITIVCDGTTWWMVAQSGIFAAS